MYIPTSSCCIILVPYKWWHAWHAWHGLWCNTLSHCEQKLYTPHLFRRYFEHFEIAETGFSFDWALSQ